MNVVIILLLNISDYNRLIFLSWSWRQKPIIFSYPSLHRKHFGKDYKTYGTCLADLQQLLLKCMSGFERIHELVMVAKCVVRRFAVLRV